jgi:xanthine dehydrogenase YagS FAD-binding subunit
MFQRGRRKSVSRHFWRRPELHRASIRHGPALVALEATFRVIGPSGEPTVPAEEFFSPPRLDAKTRRASISLPPPKPNSLQHLPQDSRPRSLDPCRGDRRDRSRDGWRNLESARVVLGGVAPSPWRLEKVEAMLGGQRITPELAARAGEAAVEGANPPAKNA